MTRFTAHLDACVLVPMALADLLLRLAERELYRPLWSTEILDEVVRAVHVVHPSLPDGLVERRVKQMDTAFPDASVTGWEHMVGSLGLPDPDAEHVAAAAIVGRADLIVTHNVKDFPPAVMSGLEIEVQTPDTFLLNQLDLAPRARDGRLGRPVHIEPPALSDGRGAARAPASVRRSRIRGGSPPAALAPPVTCGVVVARVTATPHARVATTSLPQRSRRRARPCGS
ncbi:PIN domain-containing protein [Kytococcus sedentarius]|uniref:PIN domain-containing protein n=1 Tax=Kytococcus sedentarius TaxID=1276 RepID=UPI0035BBB1FD